MKKLMRIFALGVIGLGLQVKTVAVRAEDSGGKKAEVKKDNTHKSQANKHLHRDDRRIHRGAKKEPNKQENPPSKDNRQDTNDAAKK